MGCEEAGYAGGNRWELNQQTWQTVVRVEAEWFVAV